MTIAEHELFMVFVDGKPGFEQDYADWFTGVHMADMERLPGVESACAFQLQSLDDEPAPAGLCAVYETASGAQLLQTIAASKGTDALSVSEIQGPMVWRVLETVYRWNEGDAAEYSDRVMLCMFGGEWDDDAESALRDWLVSGALPISEARLTRISPVQPARGREFGSVLFLHLKPEVDEAALLSAIKDRLSSPASRFLLAWPA